MENLPTVAVLLAAYNGEMFIQDQIKSILNQNSVKLDIFISIDKSSDNTKKIVQQLSEKNDSIFVVGDDVVFGSAAKNFFNLMQIVPIEDYDYVALSDQDDVWRDNKIHRAIVQIENNQCDCYASDLECFSDTVDQSFNYILKKSFRQRKFDYLFQGASAGCTYVLKGSVLAKTTDLISSADLWDFSHDWFLYAVTRSNGFRWFIDDQSYILYRQHDENVQGARKSLSGFISRLREVKSGWYFKHILKMEPYLSLDGEEAVIFNQLKSGKFIDKLKLMLKVNEFRRDITGRVLLLFAIVFLF